MPQFYDLGTENNGEEFREKAKELGWNGIATDFEVEVLENTEWGELKKDIQRSDAEVLIYRGGDAELHKKVAEHGKVDIIMSPERGRKDSGVDQVIAKAAAENDVAIGFNLRQLFTSRKQRTHVLKHWRRNLKLCEKYGAMKLLTTGASKTGELRAPRDAASVIDSLGFQGKEAVSKHPEKIVGSGSR
ncbi:MAG: RNase P subunit p30 family protein [Candidatus Nanohaloarchaea archaeon]